MELIGNQAVAVLHSPPEATRNGDAHFPFRQSSDIFFLTGFVEPETTIVLRPGDDEGEVVFFVRPRDPEKETWEGRRAGVDGAMAEFGADLAYPITELDERLPKLIANRSELHYALGSNPEFDRKICSILSRLRMRDRLGRPPNAVIDPRLHLHELRLHKNSDEINVIKKAAEITGEAHVAAMKLAGAGVNEYELEAVIDYTFRRRGGSGPGYTSIVGAGRNATILHYTENNCEMKNGDLVLIDAGCEFDFYTADVTRTFPASGKFSPAQARCYELVLKSQIAAVEMIKPGITIEDIHARVVEILTEGMVELGLLKGPASERIADNSYKRFYMHRTSHYLGLDVHDVGAYHHESGPRPLQPGMVITIEPGLYINEDDKSVAAEYRGIGIRIEDDVLVTLEGHENLTSMIPKTIADVEAACDA
jgi:Xaa-Pro aminopeptidase